MGGCDCALSYSSILNCNDRQEAARRVFRENRQGRANHLRVGEEEEGLQGRYQVLDLEYAWGCRFGHRHSHWNTTFWKKRASLAQNQTGAFLGVNDHITVGNATLKIMQ